MSQKYLNIWNCQTDQLLVIPMEPIDKINKDPGKSETGKKRLIMVIAVIRIAVSGPAPIYSNQDSAVSSVSFNFNSVAIPAPGRVIDASNQQSLTF